ncbi:ROK family protein, partial [uncultured Amnibacterium sp.]|uniref:ROK family transcriptional regulator n=1 Tax=uncultured Amnibacterium sp. TaxID=1631851 RepID=UPI0035C9E923
MSGVRPLGQSSEHTRSAILDLVRSSGSVSRIELAEMSGLTGASITRIVKALLDAGLVVESGLADSTGGKRRSLLELNPHARYAAGVSLDDARLTYVLADLGGRVVAESQSSGIGQTPPREVVPRIARELRDLLAGVEVPPQDVVGVGVAGAGLDLSAHAERLSTSAEEWESFPVQEELEAAIGIPVVRANDAACAALGEFWAGRIAATQDVATLYMAAGFGLGLVVGGRLLRGASANVGEIGHMVLQADGPACWCGSRGCLEILAAPRAVVAAAMA